MGICFKNMAKCYVFVYSLYFLLLFYLFRIYFLYIRNIFPLFFRSFIYVFPISYDVMHCIFAETHGIFPYFPNVFSFFTNFPLAHMYTLNNIDFCIPEMFCILPSPVLE